MFRKALLAGMAGLALAAVATAPARADQWVMLGEQKVGKNPDRDTIFVGGDEGRYEALRFRVLGNRVAFAEVRVTFGNGTSQVLNVKEHVRDGETTRPYDLKGNERVIRRIDFLYQSENPWKGQATVQVMGLKDTVSMPHANWSLLGAREVSLVADHDVIAVGESKGKFRTIRFHVTGKPIHLYDIRVTFGNGQAQTYNFNRHIPSGATSAQLDLAGNERVIDRVDLVYRKESGGGHAFLTVYGQH